MKSYRRLLPFVLLVLIVVLMSGCIPKLKDPADFTPPSWTVDVTVPVMKQELNFAESIANLFQTEDVIVDPDTHFYKFFKDFTDEMQLFEVPDLALFTDKLEFDPAPWTSDSSLHISYAFAAIPTILDIQAPGSELDILLPEPIEETLKYSEKNMIPGTTDPLYIIAPFGHARFSSSPSNVVNLTLTTNEPLDFASVTLLDRYLDPDTNQWVEVPVATTTFTLESLPNEVAIPYSTFIAQLNLADQVIHGQLDMEISVRAHSTLGTVMVTMDAISNLDIVELSGFVLGTGENEVNFDIPQITIPPIKLLEQVPGLTRIKLKSGLIRLTQDTSASCQDHELPFNISLDSLTVTGIDEEGQPVIVTSQDDGNGSWIFDLTDLILVPESAFSATIGVSLLPEGIVYDIYEDATGEVKPYSYDFQCSIENLVIDYVSGDISEVVDDPSPETEDWDYRLDGNNTGIMSMDYPEGIQDFDIGLNKIDLYLELDNQTQFKGDFTITLKTYADETGDILLKNPSLTLSVLPRTKNIYDFSEGDLGADFQEFIDIINSKPNFYEIVYGGGLGFDEADFRIGSGDYIAIPAAKIDVPIAISVGPGGAEIKGILPETQNYDPNQIQVMKQVAEFIDEASLHIKYRNTSTLGFGGRFTFKAEGKEPVVIETILYNRDADKEYMEDELVLTVNAALLDIMSSDTGYSVSADLIIPNTSTEWRSMGLTDQDSLAVTVWLDGMIKAHVPSQM